MRACTSVAGDDGLRVREAVVVAIANPVRQFVVLPVVPGVEHVLPAVCARLRANGAEQSQPKKKIINHQDFQKTT